MFSLALPFPLAEIVFLTPPRAGGGTAQDGSMGLDWLLARDWASPPEGLLPFLLVLALAVAAVRLVVLAVLGIRRRRRGNATSRRRWRAAAPPAPPRRILVDGSNVMHWKDNRPDIAPLRQVVQELRARGFTPGVVFDANAGYKLEGRFMNDRALGRMLGLPADQVLVVPKGTPADAWLLDAARQFKARIVTNDRYRDWAEAYPEVRTAGLLVPGGLREGVVWVEDTAPRDVR